MQMCAKTTIVASPTFTENRMWLNGVELSLAKSDRLNRCFDGSKCENGVRLNILNNEII